MKRHKAVLSLIMATIAFTISFAAWSLLSPLATTLQQQYGLGDFEISVLVAVPVLLGSLARIPMGMLTDRFGGHSVMTALLLFSVIPCLGMLLAHSYGSFLFWGFLLGLAGSSFAVGVPFVSRWFGPEKQGLVLGIFGVGNIGTAITARLAPQIAKSSGLTTVFVVFAGLVFVTTITFYLLTDDAPGPARPTQTLSQRLAILKHERLSWLLSLFYAVTFGGFVAFSLYLPKLLVDEFHLDKLDAGNRVAGFVILATLARPFGGWLSDKIGAPNVLAGVFLIVPALAIVLAFQPGMVVLTTCFLTMAACFGSGNGAVFKLVPQHFSKEAGAVTGLVGAAGGLGGFFPPLIMGLVKTTLGTYTLGYILLAAVAASCLLFNQIILRRPPQKHPGTENPQDQPQTSRMPAQ